ncbi:MAG: hypothetical protein JXB00_08105 [Bacteroidales bacterium]|nr:hypothetical protein [Bacteroidales bacterium]
MKARNLFYILIILTTCCEKEASVKPKDYPFILNMEITDINSSGVNVTATISDLGSDSIMEYGFVWNTLAPTIDDYRFTIFDTPKEGKFSATINNCLNSNIKYLIRPYIKCKKTLVYGECQEFISLGSLPSAINSFEPLTAKAGEEIKIFVDNINSNPEKTSILFNNLNATILRINQSEITTEVPFLYENAVISIITGDNKFTFNDSFKIITPWSKVRYPEDFEFQVYPFPSAFSINGKGYFCSGNLGDTNSTFYEYNPSDLFWTKKRDFPGIVRDGAISYSLNCKGYLGLGSGIGEEIWEYDPLSDNWGKIADFPGEGKIGALCFPVDSCVYIGLGRRNNSSEILPELWEYNQNTLKWTKKADFPYETDFIVYGTVIDKKIYVGFGPNINELYTYDPNADLWELVGSCPEEGSYLVTGFSIDGIGYFHFTRNSFTRTIWKYYPDNNLWEKAIVSPSNYTKSIIINNFAFLISNDGLWQFDPSKI